MTKTVLRKEYKAKRKVLTSAQKSEMSAKILEHLLHSEVIMHQIFHVFISIEPLNEVDTQPIIQHLLNLNKKVVLPKMQGKELLNCAYDTHTSLEKNAWGILEPIECKEIDAKSIDVVIVPMLICDNQGNRIGYGGGFYDRFFSTLRHDVLKIGINYFEPIDSIPHADYDIPIDGLITASGMRMF